MLDLGTHLALSTAWWSSDAKVVRRALWASVLTRFRIAVNASFARNKIAMRNPTTWSEIRSVSRSRRTVERVVAGNHNLCPEFLLGTATLLGFDARDCIPNNETWVAEMTVYLSAPKMGGRGPISIHDAREYVNRVLPIVATGPHLTTRAVENQLDRIPDPHRSIVRRVSAAIGPVLVGFAPKLVDLDTKSTRRNSNDGQQRLGLDRLRPGGRTGGRGG